MGKPRNFDRCWFVDRMDGDRVEGHRETRGQFVYEPWYPLVPGTIKVFPQCLCLVERSNGYSFEGTALTVVAVYEEEELPGWQS